MMNHNRFIFVVFMLVGIFSMLVFFDTSKATTAEEVKNQMNDISKQIDELDKEIAKYQNEIGKTS
jgi:cell division protein FtsL